MIRWEGFRIDRPRQLIMRDGKRIRLSPLLFRLACALLLGGPLSKEALFDILYDDRDDGGPDTGTQLIEVMMSKLKRRLARVGLEVCRAGPYGSKRYWAAPIASEAQFMEAAE